MPEQPPLPGPTLDDARNEVGRVLSDHFAEDRISVEEFERRLELTFKATTVAAVRAQLADLPDPAAPGDGVTPYSEPATSVDSRVERKASKTLVAFMSGVLRRGRWNVPKRLNVIAFMGGVDLDMHEARIGPGETNIRVLAFMGGAEIKVPADVRVECEGMAFMGGFDDRTSDPTYPSASAPVIRITGFAFMGGVEVKVSKAR